MQHALYTTSIKHIQPGGKYSRIYFGAEFCQWRLPGPAMVSKAFARAVEAGMAFTLLTPWVTDLGIKKLRAALTALSAASSGANDQTEVVINDLGVLAMLKAEFPTLTPVYGRLLVKQKRCPRVPDIMEGLPDGGKEIFLRSNVEDPVTLAFIKSFGVRRVELDNPLQGVSIELSPLAGGLSGSIYTPYAYITTTRHCPASFDGKGWQAFTGCRLKGCQRSIIRLTNPAHAASILMRGNTQFVQNPHLPDNIEEMGIDRIVHIKELP